jgi:RimJ/RimL family protein N-acetyltransferase
VVTAHHTNRRAGAQPGTIVGMNSLVHVAPVDAHNRAAVLALRVDPEQRQFVGDMADMLADAEVSANSEPMAILRGDTVVGYYRVERKASAVTGRTDEVPSLGLRSFLVDTAHQGHGIGTAAIEALCADLGRRHPDRRRLVLTVNLINTAARRVYLRTGFEDSGELYHGGRAGPQHLLWRPLTPTERT